MSSYGGKRPPSSPKIKTLSTKAGLEFPVTRIHRYLRQGRYSHRFNTNAAIYLTSVLEYITADLLEMAGNAAHANNRKTVTPRHLQLAVRQDPELDKLLSNVIIAEGGVIPYIHPILLSSSSEQR
ncbi:hypothetical protein INT45_008631 [Circinella minor]|uniref:Histone H2A n=1 Tax=Circinella minor TaxID=1195481 RepID=A0A8H7S1U0_9FUNG|nr:hypothetical protein INT45_008631 [Circinella minor]